MFGGRGDAVEFVYQHITRTFSSESHFLAIYQRAQSGGACDGGNASLGKKTDFADMAAEYFCTQFEDVSADRILPAHTDISIGQFTRVARVLEVLQELRRVHADILS